MPTYTQPTELLLLDPEKLADDLAQTMDRALPRLHAMTERDSLHPSEQGKWTPREILGHLIDSAANNHQRFVRLQIEPEIHLPGYQQLEWVAVQRYNKRPWKELVHLWEALNRHLVHLIDHMKRTDLGHEWITGESAWTLGS